MPNTNMIELHWGMPNYIAGGDMADCFGQFKNKTKWIKVKIVGKFLNQMGSDLQTAIKKKLENEIWVD